eukprot:CAMPEP_0117554754 /NCGR_PEP_ID=MMETSP0784-20121206/50919_1 /TAXON_ID=39447 /ORGANISM="" /LENGTH=1002 /DNA_ID=CAMNT_0005351933 /DNA_START=110 /DNA_END=3117 /DNA_ORIENTATION=+
MLILLEAQLVAKRRGDLTELRSMRIPPRPMHVFRDGNWKQIQSYNLVPGDIIGLSRRADISIPCDVLLLQGNVLVNEAMLTGESVPQMKVASTPAPGNPELDAPLDLKGIHKQHIVSAGTNILLHQNTSKAKNFKKVPMVGASPTAVGYVLRTGFDTTQGKLCRTILFSAERITVQSWEAYYFLMILLLFAIVACMYVLYDGLIVAPTLPDEPPRSTFKLCLAVSHIITAVVPPEFPIMLALAVNLSLIALVQKRIYCTEPFRVPIAGRVDTCCFDKTGTLTSDTMYVDGVHGVSETAPTVALDTEAEENRAPTGAFQQALPFLTTAVMGACNGLMIVDGEVVGDPLEKAALQALSWMMIGPDVIISRVGKGSERVQVLRRYPFVSELQRMAVLVKHQGPGIGHMQVNSNGNTKIDSERVLALVKGSCEALRPRLREVPADFQAIQDKLTKSGLRILCLAAKEMPSEAAKRDPDHIDREELEGDLEFCGMLALRNSIKQNTASTVKQLRRSYHRVLMITGDNPLTACQVALHVNMTERPFLVLEPKASFVIEADSGEVPNGSAALNENADLTSQLEWRYFDDASKAHKPFCMDDVKELTRKHALCVPGWAMTKFTDDQLVTFAPHVTVFARVSPQQKEQVLLALNRTSHTMMVGDGTNDVGALKHAHIGVSLLTTAVVAPPSGPPGVNPDMVADGNMPLVRLGTQASPARSTYKGDSVKCGVQILRCGRATLSTVLMMYKIMGLNSIMSAFAMSALTLDGVKLGDGQTAVESTFTSLCFFLVSRAAPAKNLAKQRPTGSVFAWHVMVTLVIQLAVHMSVLMYGWKLANSYRSQDFKRDLEGEFKPNLTNTVVFQLMAAMHASSFLANYEGHPFMQPLRSNKSLVYALLLYISTIFATTFEVVPELNTYLSLVESPNEDFRQQLTILVAVDISFAVCLPMAVNSLALSLQGRAAERRARALGFGMDEGNKVSRSSKSGDGKKDRGSKSRRGEAAHVASCGEGW